MARKVIGKRAGDSHPREKACLPQRRAPATTADGVTRGAGAEGPELALQRRLGGGKASRLCPSSSDVDLFGYGESVVDLNAEVAHRALDLLVSQQKLYCPQIARAAVDECRLCSAQ